MSSTIIKATQRVMVKMASLLVAARRIAVVWLNPNFRLLWCRQMLLAFGIAFVAANSSAQQGFANLSVAATISDAAATLGKYFTFTVTIDNAGWETATNTVVTNRLPAGLEFVGMGCSRGECIQSNGFILWALGNLPPYSAPAILKMEFRANAIGNYTNQATVVSDTPDPDLSNNQSSVISTVTHAKFFGVGSTHALYYNKPTLTLMTNNQVLMVGQHLAYGADLYNSASRSFSLPSGPMFGPHESGSATLLNNGLVLLVGGGNATGAKIAEVYNPATQLFRRVGDPLVYSYDHYSTLQPDGTVVLCGGGMTTNELFNPVTETFTLAPTKQCAFTGIYLPTGKFFYFENERAYLYDTNTSTSVQATGFLQPRNYRTATLLPNGKVLITGGYGTYGATTGPLSSAELYDPVTDKFTWTANLTTTRQNHSACLLPDGTVLVAGGYATASNSFTLTNAEVFDLNGTVNVPGIIVDNTSATEGDSGSNWMQFTVRLTTNSAFPVTVNFATTAGSAGAVDWGVANVDFANTNGTLIFAPGQTSAIVSVPVFGDLIWEPNETFTFTLSQPVQAWIARATATGTILNDDPLPTLTVLPGSLPEGDLARSNMTLQVSLSSPTPATVVVDYFTADVSASANSDYFPTNGTLAFGPGTTLLTVEVPVLGDMTPESDETFSLNITNAQYALIAGGTALGTIVNDDGLPGRLHHFDWSVISSPQVRAAPFPVTITARDYFGGVATNVPWPVWLSGQTTNYAATNLDFESPTLVPWTTFSFAAYQKTFDLQPVDVSGLGAVSMAFRMSADGGTNGIAQNIFLTGGIPYTISANVLLKVEDVGQSCWGGVLYLAAGTNSTSIVLPDICAGTVRTKISLTFTPPTSGIYPLQFTTVRSYWGEYYWVYLDDVQIGYPLITPSVATNFINGVWAGSVAAFQTGVNFSLLANDNASHKGTSGSFDMVQGHFELSTVPSPQHVQLPFPLTITAKDTLGRTVTNFSGGATLWSTVTNVPDGFYDFEEGDFSQWTPLNPGNGGPYEIVPFDVSGHGVPSLAFRLQPDWNGPDSISRPINLLAGQTYAISADVASFNANGLYVNLYPGTVALMLNGQVLTNFDFGTLGYIGVYQTFRTNLISLYTAPSNGTYQLALRFTRPVIEQQVWHYADNVRVAPACVPARWLADFTNGVWTGNLLPGTAATGVTLHAESLFDYRGSGNQFYVTPTADLGLTGGSAPAQVRAGSDVTFLFTLTNRGPSTAASVLVSNVLDANFRFRSATTSQGSFAAYGNTVVYNLGSLSNRQQVTLSVTAKPYFTGLVTNLATVTSDAFDPNAPDNAMAFALTADVPLVHADNISITELDTGTNFASVPIWLEGPVGQALSLNYATTNGSATAGNDFVPVSGTLVFAPDVVTQFVNVPIRGDLTDEPNETLGLLLSNPANAAFAQTQATVTIIDNDPPPTISIADTALLEGDSGTTNAVFQLVLSKLAITDVSVLCTTATNTASANDYTHTVTTVTFPAGATNATYSVSVRGNTVNEPDETFLVNLTLPVNATIARTQAVGTIINDDAVPGRLDHFVWDAIPSPRYKDWPFPVILRAVDYLGNPATNTLGTIPVKARTENGFLERLQDDFEDGDSIGWTNFNASFTATVTNETAAGGVKSLRFTGSTANLGSGLRRTITNIQPNRISFAVRASRTNQVAGRFTANLSSLYRSAVFYFNNNGQMGLLDRTLGFRGVPYQSNRWYQIELSLNWTSQKIDCRVDGALVLTNITFPDSSASSMDAVLLANQDNTTSWWDDIRVFHDNLTNNFSITPSNFTAFVSGVKSNLVTISGSGTGTNTFLSADDGLEHVGTSGLFDLRLANLMLITPASVTEGNAPISAQLRIPVSFPQPITVMLTSSIPTELTVPASVVIPANQTNASFNITIIDDALLDGAQPVSVIASATNLLSGTNIISVEDNEPAILTVMLPATTTENAGTLLGLGQVTSSAPPNKSVTVTLTSSDTNVVQVPASVIIQSNETSATFDLVIVDNQRIDGAHSANITASVVNWTSDTKIITVMENETTNLRLFGPGQLNEGAGSVSYTAHLSGTLVTNLTVSLASSSTNTLVVQPSVLLLAGQTSVAFPVTAPDNAFFEGSKLVTLSASAPGFALAATNVIITDNEFHHFNFSAIASPQQGSVAFNFTMTARDINDALIASYATNVTLTANDGLGNPVQVSPSSVSLVNGQWSGSFQVTAWEFQNVRIIATDPGGRTNQSGPFNVIPPTVSLINLAASDLVYSEVSKQVYASIPSSSALRPINPFNSTLGSPIGIANLSGRLCASDGGQNVFVALDGATNHICQFDVSSQSVVNAWPLDGFYVDDMAHVAGSPSAVAVSRKVIGVGQRFRGIVIYDNGLARTNYGIYDSTEIEPGRIPGRLYGYFHNGVLIMNMDASGISYVGGWEALQGFDIGLACRGGWIFVATTGAILDPERGIQVGSFAGLVGDDAASGRYYLVSAGAIAAFDQNTLLPVGTTVLPGITGAAGSLIRWGTNGFAFRVNSSQIALIRTPLIATGPSANLHLTVKMPSLPIVTSNVLTYTLTVSNQGPAVAQNVVLTQTLPANSAFLSATSSSGSNVLTGGGLVSPLLGIPAGGSVTVTVNLQTLKAGLLASVASITSDSLDLNLSNNVLRLHVPVATVPTRDTVTEIILPSTDLIWDKFSGRIFASTPNADWLLGNSLLMLDPLTGFVDDRIPVGLDPTKLAVASDGSYLYTALQGEPAIQRVNIGNREADKKFPTIRNTVFDLEVLPDKPTSVVATVHLSPEVVVYDDGVILPNLVSPGEYQSPYPIEFGDSPSRLYAAMPGGLRRIAITTNGATLLEDVGGLINGFDTTIEYDAGRIFTAGGRVFDPEAKTMIGTVPYSGLVMPDASVGRAFYLQGSGATYNLVAVNFTNLHFVGSIAITNVAGTPTSLIRWGTDGVAFRTSGGQIFLIRTTLADDRDNDLLPDSWELQFFPSISATGAGPTDDPDQDGMNNLKELATGSNPLLFDSLRFLSWQMQTNGSYVMSMLGTIGTHYALLASTNLSNWVPILDFTCTNIPTIVIDAASPNLGQRFYRIGPLSSIPRPQLGFASSPLSAAGVGLTLNSFPGVHYRVEVSTNLVHWVTITNFVSTNAVMTIYDSTASGRAQSYYRAVTP